MEIAEAVDACLDYATIQIFPCKNRYEVFICGNDEVEKLAVGELEHLLPHLPGVHDLNAKGSNAIFKLQVTTVEPWTASWFTKSTLKRFLQVVGSSDLVNTSHTIEGEMLQLEETRKFHLSLYAQEKANHPGAAEIDGFDSIGTEATMEAEKNTAASDVSKNELLRAMDLRLAALRSELVAVLDQAVGATCSSRDMSDLLLFCEHFGATDLKNSLCKILKLTRKSATADSHNASTCEGRVYCESKKNNDAHASRPAYSPPPVKYGASPAKAAQVERQSSDECEESSESSGEKNVSAERSRAFTRSATTRRSASPMRRIQIGRTGSRRAAALMIKSLNYYPVTERTSQRDAAATSSEDEGTEPPVNKVEHNVRRMSVQDAINLFESKQKDQTTDVQKRISTSNVSPANKSVIRRWSAGIAECNTHCQPEIVSEDAVPLPCNNSTAGQEIALNVAEEKLDSNFTYGCQNRVESTEVDVVSERWEKNVQDPADNYRDRNGTKGGESNEKLTASEEWSRQKELELNHMLMKMMEIQPVRSRKPESNTGHGTSAGHRGDHDNHYKERKEKKLREENAEKEPQFRATQKILDKRKAEMASKNVKDLGKRPSYKPQKSLNNPRQTEIPRNGSLNNSDAKKTSSKSRALPATRKSWPSTPSSRAAVSFPSKTPTAVLSSCNTSTSRKSQRVPSLPPSSTKVEQPRQHVRNPKEVQINVERKVLKGAKGMKQQTMENSGKGMKIKAPAANGDGTAKPSLYNRVTKKTSVVPLESKPLKQKGSGTSPGVGPTVNKTKHPSQSEVSSLECQSKRQTQENVVVADTAVIVSEHYDQGIVSFVHCDAAVESEPPVESHQACGEENLNEFPPVGDCSIKDTAESSEAIQPREELDIPPTAWVEVGEEQVISNSCNDGRSEPNSPDPIAPLGLSSPYSHHSLSQMLQEDNNSDPDTVEWGNAVNPPAVVYQKNAPKGFRRLLKFARKSKREANLTGWSSLSVYSEGEDDAEESKPVGKKNTANLLRKAALHARNSRHQNTSSLEEYEKKMNVHQLLSAESKTSKFKVQSSHKLNKDDLSTTSSTTKASRSFFSLAAFRGSKPNETKL